ncbi:glycosyltransferase family 2 protein [Haloarchaeobius litoreus]|uniref:Glycosyltransferase family 2 protein n=1 Tax=Haloarchaeobius litoreus TaxID=755306 RepID=A0ABD6DN51_9EURY|nr:glycosyltransferase family 2 protein [Haloarchaeobius litoreus]
MSEPSSRQAPRDADSLLVPQESEATPTISFVMPTMNEEGAIAECIEWAKSALLELGVTGEIVVSDSSTDRTPKIAREHGARVITPDGRGYGYAYRYAFEHVRGEYVVIGDADTTYDFRELPELFALVESGEADMAMGSRLNGDMETGAMPALHRYVGNPLLTKFLNVFYGTNISDAHSGFRVISRDALEQLDLRTDGMEFASEMIMKAASAGLEIREVPITYRERTGDATLESFRDGWRHVRFMLINAPDYLFTIPAVLTGGTGLGLLGAVAADGAITGLDLGARAVVLGCLLLIVAHQTAVLATTSAIVANPIRKPSDPVTRFVTERFRLEHGLALGTGLLLVGGSYTLVNAVGWLNGNSVPLSDVDTVAFTLLVLGVLTVFDSFFLSVLGERDSP